MSLLSVTVKKARYVGIQAKFGDICTSPLTKVEMESNRVFTLCLYIYLFTESYKHVGGCSLMSRQDYLYSGEWAGFYKVHYNPMTWEKAHLTCQMEGASLAIPYSNKDTIILSQIISPPQLSCGIFIGVKEVQSKGQMDYKTIEGISLCRIPYEWAKNEPNSFGDSCLVLLQDGTLADEPCTESLPFVCYKKFDDECNACRNPCKTNDRGYKFEQRTGSCYKFHNKPETWGGSVKTCANEGGHLVIINSDTESAILRDMFAEYPAEKIIGATYTVAIHVGFHELFQYGDWRNIDGKNLTESGYATWAPGEPNHHGNNEHCGCVFRSGLLYDVGCDAKCAFICEIESKPICHIN